MKSVGIRYQILLITLIPVLLVDGYFTWSHIHRGIEQETGLLRAEGRIAARQLARDAAQSLEADRVERLQARLEQLIGHNDIVMATVFDSSGSTIATATAPGFDPVQGIDYLYFREALATPGGDATALVAEPGAQRQSDAPGWVNLYLSDRPLRARQVQIITESVLVFFLVLAIAVILTFMISQRITRPIFAMLAHLRYVETGRLGKTIEATERNEIGALQRGFNRMTEALLANRRHLNHRIQQATQQLNEAITDLEAKNRELGFARDLAQDASRTKSEFLANMSHEIRTPINGIKGFISLLGNTGLDPTQRRYVDIITRSTSDLTNIVDEILDFSKMESGKLHIVDEAFDLYEVIEQTRDLLFINVLAKGIDLNLVLFSDVPRRVIGDKLRLKQILLNLVGNAIKFTDQGRVVIRAAVESLDDDIARLHISVEDSGIGISQEDQKQLFHAFSQVESSDTRRFTGTGLGLVISKNLAMLMGGDISMQSTPGEGSRFCLRLPLRLEEPRHDLEPPADAPRALIFAADPVGMMEVRTLLDRAGAITEAELVEQEADTDAMLRCVQRNRHWLDLMVVDLRHLAIDLDNLLGSADIAGLRIIVMHYDPGAEDAFDSDRAEFVSIITTSNQFARILQRDPPRPDFAEDAGEPVARGGKKVLLVDDNQVNLKLASELIRLWGHEVREAEHGEQALELYRQESFDLVILDIQMPDIDGVSLMHMMREQDPEAAPPMVALTANVLNREADRLLGLGFDYFLGKPIDEAMFRSLLDGQPRRHHQPGDDSATAPADDSFDYQSSLALSAGNEALLKQILEILQRDIPEQRQQLSDAYAQRDFERLAALAHKLQGVTCYASLPRLRRDVLKLQQRLGDDPAAPFDELMRQLDDELEAVSREVAQHLQEMAASEAAGQDSNRVAAAT